MEENPIGTTDSWLWSGSGLGNFTNDTLSCVAESLAVPVYPYNHALSIATRVVQITFYVLLFIASTPLNSLMIYLIARFKSLQTMSFALVLQVVILNLIATLVFIPLTIITVAANEWLLGEIACVVSGTAYYTVGFIRTELMLCLVIDRFLLVFCPFCYPKYRRKTLIFFSIISHAVPIILAIIAGCLGCVSFSPGIGQCHFSSNCGEGCTQYRGSIALSTTLPSCIVSVFLYGGLFYKARNGKSTPTCMDIAGADLDGHKREMRANITFFLMFLALSAVTAPHAISYLISSTVYYLTTPPLAFQIVEGISGNIISLILVLDPIVLMRNAEVKDEIAKIKWLPNWWC